jgi:alkylhydroperoxidase/carboxymuconolactone decarboxylase family protein YurZ
VAAPSNDDGAADARNGRETGMRVELNERERKLREAFVETRGFWSDPLQALLETDPDFFAAFLRLAAVPWRTGSLDPKVKELVCIAVDGAATHLYEPGFRLHVRRALELGATKEELLEVLQLTSTLGIHACNIGVPLLQEAMAETGSLAPQTLTERQEELKADFTAKRGYWHSFWNGLLELDPDFFEGYTEFSSHPWTQGVLEPKVKELIYTAFDASATHLYVPGLRQHIENALAYGATAAEIMEVFEIASLIGIHTCTMGIPIVLEELARADSTGAGS